MLKINVLTCYLMLIVISPIIKIINGNIIISLILIETIFFMIAVIIVRIIVIDLIKLY